MTHPAPNGLGTIILAAVVTAAFTVTAAAGQRPNASAGRQGPEVAQQGPTQPEAAAEEGNAQQTREKLEQLLEKSPPALGRVLKLDPSLMTSPAYLAPYPLL